MRFLRLIRGRYSMFKKVRIGFSLLRNSFKSVFFSHHHYFFLCLALTGIQFIHLKITGFMYHRLTLSFLMTELLAGENFFEILWHDTPSMLSGNNLFTFLHFIALLYLKIILTFFVLCAAAHYTFKQNNSMQKSILTSLTHWHAVCAWGFIELCAQGSSSLLGIVGALLYFAWNIITIFDVQILSFDHASARRVIKKSWKLFKQSFSQVVALDVIIEAFLIIIGFAIYSISKQYMSGTPLIELENYNEVVIFLTLYLISSVMIFEVVVFTNLYKTIEKKDNNVIG